MSSHHVIREAQEPALLVLDPEYLADTALASLLEWSPTIVVPAEVFPRLTESGLKIDVVVGTQEQLRAIASMLEWQAPLAEVISQPTANPVLAALSYLKEKEQQALNILCTHGQLQQPFLQLLAEQEFVAQIVLLDGKERYALCRSGEYSKWLPAGEKLRVLPLIKSTQLSSTGFTQDLHQAAVQEAHTFQAAQTGSIQINASGAFWVIESLS